MQVLLKMVGTLYHVLSAQNAALVYANQGLEESVAQRTHGLAQAHSGLQQVNVQLQALGRTDGLLQIANRGYFDNRLAQASASAFMRQKPLALLMIDVHAFKSHNDHFGHQAEVQAVRSTLQRVTDLVGRYGAKSWLSSCPTTMLPAPALWPHVQWPAWRRSGWRIPRPAPAPA